MAEQNSERKVIKVAYIAAPNPKFPTLLEFKGEDGVKYETWVKALAPEIKLDAELDCDITHSEKKGESGTFYHHKVTQIYKDGKPIYQAEAKPGGRSYGKSDKELAQQREIEDAKRRSIEAQTALIQAVNLAAKVTMAGENDLKVIIVAAREFYQLFQSLTQMPKKESGAIPFVVKIIRNQESIKPPEQTKTEPDEEPPVITAGELMKWASSHGKEFGPSWVKSEAGLRPLEVITNEKAATAKKLLKEKMKWEE